MKRHLPAIALAFVTLPLTACGDIDINTVRDLLQQLTPPVDQCGDQEDYAALYAPVCGEDGITYNQICEAQNAGVGVAYEGECEDILIECFQQSDCPVGYGCILPAIACEEGSDCTDELFSGSCVREGNPGCTEQFDPVCGVDGQTYGNDCEANVAGIDILHWGECQTENPCHLIDCPEGTVCEEFAGLPIDGSPEGTEPNYEAFAQCVPVDAAECSDDSDCDEGALCIFAIECFDEVDGAPAEEFVGTCVLVDEPAPCEPGDATVCGLIDGDIFEVFGSLCEAEERGAEVVPCDFDD